MFLTYYCSVLIQSTTVSAADSILENKCDETHRPKMQMHKLVCGRAACPLSLHLIWHYQVTSFISVYQTATVQAVLEMITAAGKPVRVQLATGKPNIVSATSVSPSPGALKMRLLIPGVTGGRPGARAGDYRITLQVRLCAMWLLFCHILIM